MESIKTPNFSKEVGAVKKVRKILILLTPLIPQAALAHVFKCQNCTLDLHFICLFCTLEFFQNRPCRPYIHNILIYLYLYLPSRLSILSYPPYLLHYFHFYYNYWRKYGVFCYLSTLFLYRLLINICCHSCHDSVFCIFGYLGD